MERKVCVKILTKLEKFRKSMFDTRMYRIKDAKEVYRKINKIIYEVSEEKRRRLYYEEPEKYGAYIDMNELDRSIDVNELERLSIELKMDVREILPKLHYEVLLEYLEEIEVAIKER